MIPINFKDFAEPLTVGQCAEQIVSWYDMPLSELVEAWNRAKAELFTPSRP